MALYCYRCDCGKVQEISMGMNDIHPEYIDCPCGKGMARRSFRDESHGNQRGDLVTHSLSMAVMAHQKAAAEKEMADAGVPTTFEVRGRFAVPRFDTMDHWRKGMKVLGYADRDSYR